MLQNIIKVFSMGAQNKSHRYPHSMRFLHPGKAAAENRGLLSLNLVDRDTHTPVPAAPIWMFPFGETAAS